MKVRLNLPPQTFQPIAITLESYFEAVVMWHYLHQSIRSSQDDCTSPVVNEFYAKDRKQMFEAFDKVFSPRRTEN
jgi:hypothetical protein